MKKVVFITGISSGFGEKMAIELSKDSKYKVYGTIRKQGTNIPNVSNILMDVTDENAIKKGINSVLEKEGRIDVLINNAGYLIGGAAETTPNDQIHKIMNTNFMGVVNTIKACLPSMRAQKSGLIINISSLNGLFSTPYVAYYSASKFAVEGFSESLRMELKPFNIKVVQINPGDFATNCTFNRTHSEGTIYVPEYEDQYKKTIAIIEKDEQSGLKPEILAKKIKKIIENKKPKQRYIIASFDQKMAAVLNRFLPDSLFKSLIENHYKI